MPGARTDQTPKHPLNADLAALQRFFESGRQPTAVDTNPMAQALGMRLIDIDAQAGRIKLEFEPAPYFVQGTNVLQGGAVAGMLDFAMAFATLATVGAQQSCASVNLNTSFLKAARPGRYVAVGELDRRARTMAFANATLATVDEPDAPVATATSVLVITG